MYAAYLVMDQMKGRPSSALMFFFWLIVAITDGIIFRSHIKVALNYGVSTPRDSFLFVVRVLYYPAVLLQLFLSIWNAKSLDEEPDLKKPEQLWDLNPEDRAHNIAQVFARQRDRRKTDASLGWALVRAFWPELVYSALLKLVYNAMLFLIPRILSLLIGFVKNKEEEVWKGYLFAMLLFVASVIQTLSIGHYFHRCNKLGIRLRTAAMGGVYKKSPDRTREFDQGANVIPVTRMDFLAAWEHLPPVVAQALSTGETCTRPAKRENETKN
ncbi:hypothetical protein RvY_08092 [Ramazzottius varieornatus]|uniref:ABC transmembrane type-1 domain-containing protein n=1 Tax=Ramazzottius varieornatus TaxID=947166 RepID=A0A1D1V4P6_RAMVA|nr:hypothetical protein RvY_08092 [Ramazzottius varieornatus]